MKLASVLSKNPKNRSGNLIVVSRDNKRAVYPDTEKCSSLLYATQNWREVEPYLQGLFEELNRGNAHSFAVDSLKLLAPLPSAPGFYDGSAFLSHVYRARKSRGDEMPESAKKIPLMYQGVSDNLLNYNAPIDRMSPEFGADFEGEIGAITDDVPKGTKAADASRHIILLTLFNDITYRVIVKTEIETKFGFLQSKPNSSFAPFVVTPDELEKLWDGERFSGELQIRLNGEIFGHPNAKQMHFTFPELVAHACRTRPLSGGSIVGSGTLSNEDASCGFACIVEKRFQEILDTGKATHPWLEIGDRVEMDVMGYLGHSIFGKIDEKVVQST